MLPLAGIKIIDLTRILSGPFCTMTLADLGAEVIKIESPQGDDTRQWGPPFIKNESAYFLSVNRNKKSVVLNLKDPKGKEILLKMVEEADVVVENFRPGTLKKLGIDYDILKQHNRGVILASISGFGQTGPYSKKPGYDVLAQGMGGLMSVTGEPDGTPVKAGYSLADIGAGMWATIGILSALWERERSGQGQWIDVSLLDTMVSWQTYLAGNYFATNNDPKPLGGAHPNIVPYQVFEASDGHFILAVGNDSLWNSLVDVLDVEALRDRKFKTNPDRVQNRDELISILEEIFKRKTRDEWVDMLESAKIPCGPVNKLSDILNDAHIKEREMVVEMEHPSLGILKMLGVPVKLSRTPGRIKTVPPAQGEHSETVLKQMGYSKEEIETFIKEGIIIPQQKCV
ncbi:MULTISPECIES: CaiB/BaiF CoA transferase family protein [Aeribacillus]|jgi:crotonobetainyl-CoA:carnitine CoA-transferase CaiB-like acyl-CoA transferase|uniref:CaiB/BaiF CoA transferase family protein n=1 Tax=Aeribacillus TaxID=1055323 RepID=UPI0007B463CA|nr:MULTISPECIES: CoA transferase [Aeribacillus]KZM53094.1 formyl-CoA transferase [Aeribacillus pallidus]MED0651930.1 CoA transferase [Aeribacillus composti]MED4485262.1 CoA transferase [Aeribacillus pallidus]BBU39651.1 CoA transferase [Aeribacillus pallidus]